MNKVTTSTSVSDTQFWSLLQQSGLLSEVEISRMREASAGKRLDSGSQIATWLVSQLAITPYQGQVLAAGQSGPFVYGDFFLEGRIEGQGGKQIFSATHRLSRHPVQLDFLNPTAGESEVALARRVETAQQHCRVRHPGLTDCYVLEQLPDYKFLVLESPGGTRLSELVATRGPIDPPRAAYWIGQLALSLQVLHNANLCHGRVHPDNIVIENDGARLIRNPLRHPLPLKSPVVGHSPNWTLPIAFATPELSAWDRWPDASADLYGLGGVLHYLVTGKPAFPGESTSDLIRQHMNAVPPSIAAQAGPELDSVLQQLLAKTTQSRMPSASDLGRAIAPILPSQVICQPPNEAPTFAPFFAAMQTRQTTVEAEVAARSVDPKFANRVSENLKPVVESENWMESRGLDQPASSFESRWLMPVISVAAALLTLFAGRALLKPIDDGIGRQSDVALTRPDDGSSAGSGEPSTSTTSDDTDTGDPVVMPIDPAERVALAEKYDRFAINDDDGQLLWAPLTDGEPHLFPYAQEGGQLFIAVRPADLLKLSEGDRAIQALGPDFATLRQRWEAKHRVSLDQVEQLIVVISADANSRPVSVSDIRMRAGLKRPDSWAGDEMTNTQSGPCFTSGGMACLVPSGTNQQRFVIGPEALIREIGDRGGDPALLRREFEALREFSDADAQFTMLLAPSYLLRDGRNLVSTAYRSLPIAMDEFFGDGVGALMFTAHISEESAFAELRLATTVETQRPLRRDLPGKIANVSSLVESYVSNLHRLDTYWRQVALRYDNMLRFLSKQTRVGIENRQLVMNTHLPASAAHNLILATELSLAAGVSNAPDAVAAATPKRLKSIEEVLIQRTSLNIPQQSLEFSMRDLQEDVNENIDGLPFPLRIEIVGADLQLDGITRNQQIRDFSGENERIADLLTGLVMRANPVTTVKQPNEPDQKLVWVVDHPNNGNPKVLITTRNAAKSRGYKLPRPFRLN